MRGGCDVGFVVAMPMECDRVRVAWVRLARHAEFGVHSHLRL